MEMYPPPPPPMMIPPEHPGMPPTITVPVPVPVPVPMRPARRPYMGHPHPMMRPMGPRMGPRMGPMGPMGPMMRPPMHMMPPPRRALPRPPQRKSTDWNWNRGGEVFPPETFGIPHEREDQALFGQFDQESIILDAITLPAEEPKEPEPLPFNDKIIYSEVKKSSSKGKQETPKIKELKEEEEVEEVMVFSKESFSAPQRPSETHIHHYYHEKPRKRADHYASESSSSSSASSESGHGYPDRPIFVAGPYPHMYPAPGPMEYPVPGPMAYPPHPYPGPMPPEDYPLYPYPGPFPPEDYPMGGFDLPRMDTRRPPPRNRDRSRRRPRH